MMAEIILSILFGFGLHQTKRVTDHFPRGWRELTNSTIGVMGLLAMFPFWYRRIGGEHNQKRGFAALALSALGVGCGVAGGWAVDTFKRMDE
jgi:hypothetical protein